MNRRGFFGRAVAALAGCVALPWVGKTASVPGAAGGFVVPSQFSDAIRKMKCHKLISHVVFPKELVDDAEAIASTFDESGDINEYLRKECERLFDMDHPRLKRWPLLGKR